LVLTSVWRPRCLPCGAGATPKVLKPSHLTHIKY